MQDNKAYKKGGIIPPFSLKLIFLVGDTLINNFAIHHGQVDFHVD